VRRPVLQEAIVVVAAALAPTTLGVVTGLVGQYRRLFRLEIDLAFGVVVALRLIQDVHGYEGKPRRCDRLPPSAVPSVNVSSPTGVPDDAYWQRPDSATGPLDRPPTTAPQPAPGSDYKGPPQAPPPPPDWRPPTFAQPTPPRTLPPQDMDALDEAEGSARTVTYGVGLVAGAIAVILICLLCARVMF
jgi:hypothetical protein